MELTTKAFSSVFPRAKSPELWVDTLNKVLPEYEIDNENRVAAFLAQCGHESAGFTAFQENLNYSADALKRVFPKYFKDVNPEDYARKPEKIANRVYGNRMGNGSESSGDGWKYRGRGLIQLTGKNNYQRLADYFRNQELVKHPDLVCNNIEYCVLSAVWFWTVNNLNILADKEDLTTMTKRINGGTNGLEDRIYLYTKIKEVLV